MAVKATFQANFDSFLAAIDKADIKLADLNKGAEKVGPTLNRMIDKFSGRKLIQEASLMTIAIEKAGGVAQLTGKELEQVGNKANEAAEKLRKMGSDVPIGLQRIADTAKSAESQFSGLASGAIKLAGAFGIGFGLSAVVSFGKALLEDADALVKLSDKTGISISGLQRLRAAGDDAGNTIEDMAGAVNKLQDKLAGGDESAVNALTKLGLTIQQLRALDPDEQFIAISDAIRKIKDPADQVNIAVDLFGKTGAEVLPTLKRGFDDLKESAAGMSDRTVRSLDTLGDNLTSTGRKIKAFVANAIVDFASIEGLGGFSTPVERMKKEIDDLDKDLGAFTDKAIKSKALTTGFLAASFQGVELTQQQLKDIVRDLDVEKAKLDAVRAAEKAAAEALKPFNEAMKEIDAATGGFGKTLDSMSGDLVESVKFYLDAGVAASALATAYGLTDVQIKAIATSRDVDTKLLILNTTATIANANALSALGQVENEEIRLIKERVAWQTTLQKIEFEAASTIGEGLDKVGQKVRVLTDDQEKLLQQMAQWRTELGELSHAFAQLAQVSGGAFGGIVKDIAVIVNSLDLATTAADNFFKATGKVGKAAAAVAGIAAVGGATSSGSTAARTVGGAASGFVTGAAIGSVIPGIGTAVGGAIGAIAGGAAGLFRGLFGNDPEKQINPIREAFVQAAGGLDALNKHAHDAGVTLDHLLNARNAEQYKAAIDELTAAFKRNEEQIKKADEMVHKLGADFTQIVKGSIIGSQIKGWDDLAKRIEDANVAWDKAKKAGDMSGLQKANQDWLDLTGQQRDAAKGFKQELDDLGVVALASYGAAIKAGHSLNEALAMNHDGLTMLAKAYEDLGLPIDNVMLKAILVQNSLLDKSPELLASVDALASSFDTLSQFGLLNADTFAAMERTGMQAFTRIQAQVAAVGGTQRDALMPMQDYLHQAEEAAKALGIPLDENTQMLINQSKELGIWKEKGKSANDLLLEGLQKLVDKMNDFINAINGVPKTIDVTGNVNWNVPDIPEQTGPNVGPPSPPGVTVPTMSQGGVVMDRGIGGRLLPFKPRGTDTVPAMLTPGEIVLNKTQQAALLGGVGEPITLVSHITVQLDGQIAGQNIVTQIARGKRGIDVQLKKALGIR